MPLAFDPYETWLGILPHEQPANHYRLLGVALYESDLDKINQAANARAARLFPHQRGETAHVANQIVSQVAAARLCLLSADRKVAYDAYLRSLLEKSYSAPQHAKYGTGVKMGPTFGGLIEERNDNRFGQLFYWLVMAGLASVLVPAIVYAIYMVTTSSTRHLTAQWKDRPVAGPSAPGRLRPYNPFVEPNANDSTVSPAPADRQTVTPAPGAQRVGAPVPASPAQPTATIEALPPRSRERTYGTPVDLVSRIDLQRDRFLGAWTQYSSHLEARTTNLYAILDLPLQPPAEYDLEILAYSTSTDLRMSLLFVWDNEKTHIAINDPSDVGPTTGIWMREPSTASSADNPTRYLGQPFQRGARNYIRLEVRTDRIGLVINEQTIIDWEPNHDQIETRNIGRWWRADSLLSINAMHSAWHLQRIQLTPVSPAP